MADLHIEEFYRDIGTILVQLYGAFPRKTSVYVEDVAGDDRPDEFGLHSKRHLACLGAMIWLAEEGWIRYVDTIGQQAIDQATLTQVAFTRLSAEHAQAQAPSPTEPPAMDAAGLRIDLIREALRTGSSTQIAAVVKAMLFGI